MQFENFFPGYPKKTREHFILLSLFLESSVLVGIQHFLAAFLEVFYFSLHCSVLDLRNLCMYNKFNYNSFIFMLQLDNNSQVFSKNFVHLYFM